MAMSDSVSLLFRIRSDSSQAVGDVRNLVSEIEADTKKIAASFSDNLKDVGKVLSVGITAPLLALATLGTKSALEIDAVRTKITALVGDSEKAGAKMAELRNLANNSVGVTQAAAYASFAQLKGIGGIADESINKLIASMGKLNSAFTIPDTKEFSRNLVQIFSQDFERQDIKQALGTVPIFEQLMQQAFGTTDQEKLKQLKNSGKLTLDTFLSGLADAVNNDSRVANISESLSGKLAKGLERANAALAPLGDIILNIFVPMLETLAPYLEQVSIWFSSLSPTIQTAIVAVGGFVAALAPVLIAIGSVISSITAIVGAVGTLGGLSTILPIIAGITAGLVIFSAEIYAIYQIWQTNFGGIRDFTLAVWQVIKSTISEALSQIYTVVQSIGGQILAWWRENYPLIKETIETVSNAIKATISSFLDAVKTFWANHGESIKDYVSTSWNFIKSVVSQVINQIQAFIKLGLLVINGDWSSAWQVILQITQNGARLAATIWSGMIETIKRLLMALIPILAEYGARLTVTLTTWTLKAIAGVIYILATLPQQIAALIPKFIAAGSQIGSAIWQGIKDGLASKTIELPKIGDSQGGGLGLSAEAKATATPKGGGGGGSIDKGSADKAKNAREKYLDEQIKGFDLSIDAQRIAFDERKTQLENQLKAEAITFDTYREQMFQAITEYQGKINAFYEQQKNVVSQRFGGQEALNQLQEIANKQAETTKRFDDESEKAVLEVRELKIKSKQIESEQILKLAKSEIDKELAENERAYTAKEKSEIEYVKFKDAKGVDLLEKEKKQIDLRIQNIALLLAAEAKLRNMSGEQLLKENSEYNELLNDSLVLSDEIETKKRESKANTAKFSVKLSEELEQQQRQAEQRGTELNFENDRKRYNNLIEHNHNVVENLRGLRELELEAFNSKLDEQQRLQDDEEQKRLDSIKGVENEEKEKKRIRDYYKTLTNNRESERSQGNAGINQEFNLKTEQAEMDASGGGFLGGVMRGAGVSAKQLNEDLSPLTTIGNIVGSQFNAIAQAVGNAVHAFVLFGSAGGGFKKFAAEMIASIAQMSAVQAVWELAQGLAMVALAFFGFHPKAGASASAHFAAAAVYAGIAGVAAVAGRGVAGDSFNQASASNTQSNTQSKNADSSPTVFNQQAKLIEENRLYRQEQDKRTNRIETALANINVDVKLHQTATLDRGIISNTVMEDMNRQHPLRDYFRELAEVK